SALRCSGWSIPFTIAASFLPICAAWVRKCLPFTAKVTTTPRSAKLLAAKTDYFGTLRRGSALLLGFRPMGLPNAQALVIVKRMVCGAEQVFDGGAVARKFSNADAHRDARLFRILRQSLDAEEPRISVSNGVAEFP